MGQLAMLPIAIYGGYSVDASRVKLVIRAMIEANKKPGAVFVDHLQLMSHPKSASRDEAVGETTRQFRLMSLELEVPIILLCQMNRQQDTRGQEEKRPKLSDLRESGSIEANAPNIIFLWRASSSLEDAHKTTVTLAKHRDGPTAECELIFRKAIGVFGGKTIEEGLGT
jgi:replicative DNA helicase